MWVVLAEEVVLGETRDVDEAVEVGDVEGGEGEGGEEEDDGGDDGVAEHDDRHDLEGRVHDAVVGFAEGVVAGPLVPGGVVQQTHHAREHQPYDLEEVARGSGETQQQEEDDVEVGCLGEVSREEGHCRGGVPDNCLDSGRGRRGQRHDDECVDYLERVVPLLHVQRRLLESDTPRPVTHGGNNGRDERHEHREGDRGQNTRDETHEEVGEIIDEAEEVQFLREEVDVGDAADDRDGDGPEHDQQSQEAVGEDAFGLALTLGETHVAPLDVVGCGADELLAEALATHHCVEGLEALLCLQLRVELEEHGGVLVVALPALLEGSNLRVEGGDALLAVVDGEHLGAAEPLREGRLPPGPEAVARLFVAGHVVIKRGTRRVTRLGG